MLRLYVGSLREDSHRATHTGACACPLRPIIGSYMQHGVPNPMSKSLCLATHVIRHRNVHPPIHKYTQGCKQKAGQNDHGSQKKLLGRKVQGIPSGRMIDFLHATVIERTVLYGSMALVGLLRVGGRLKGVGCGWLGERVGMRRQWGLVGIR